MKHPLLCSTAIALVGTLPGMASAAEWEVRVGGYMEQYLAYANTDGPAGTDFDGVDSKQDSEIHFMPSITLDNGITIGAQIELEGLSAGGSSDTIDEAFLRIDGSFGEILLGSSVSAGYLMHYGAPDVTFVNVNSGSMTAFIPFSGTTAGLGVGSDNFYGTLGTTYLENFAGNGVDEVQRFTYFTPRFAGFQLGASYARDGGQDSNAQIDTKVAGTLHDIFDVGANYVNEFGDLSIALSGRYGNAQLRGAGRATIWGTGLNIGYAGITIGGSFAEQNGTPVSDGTSWDAGASYETGPWGFSFTFMHGENFDDESPVPGSDEELKQYLVGVSYGLAEGVTLNGFGAYVDFEEDVGDAGGAGDNIDGFVIGSGIKVEF